MLLDALLAIQAQQDPGLDLRVGCRRGRCGACAAIVNGRSLLPCCTPLSRDVTGVSAAAEPWPAAAACESRPTCSTHQAMPLAAAGDEREADHAAAGAGGREGLLLSGSPAGAAQQERTSLPRGAFAHSAIYVMMIQ